MVRDRVHAGPFYRPESVRGLSTEQMIAEGNHAWVKGNLPHAQELYRYGLYGRISGDQDEKTILPVARFAAYGASYRYPSPLLEVVRVAASIEGMPWAVTFEVEALAKWARLRAEGKKVGKPNDFVLSQSEELENYVMPPPWQTPLELAVHFRDSGNPHLAKHYFNHAYSIAKKDKVGQATIFFERYVGMKAQNNDPEVMANYLDSVRRTLEEAEDHAKVSDGYAALDKRIRAELASLIKASRPDFDF